MRTPTIATISISTGGCSAARAISQPAVAVSATPDAAASAPSRVPPHSRSRTVRADASTSGAGETLAVMTEMALVAATDAIVPVEPRYLETVGLMSVIGKINDIREGWRQPNLRVSGILVTR